MTKIPLYWKKANRFLSAKDKTMEKLIKDYSVPSETILTTRKDIFFSLCKSIIAQQISVAAANTVFLRFKKKCSNKINVNNVLKLNTSQLRSCGLSKQKVIGIKSLANKIKNKAYKPNLIDKMLDEEAIIYLTQLKQTGRWSGERILFITYNRS